MLSKNFIEKHKVRFITITGLMFLYISFIFGILDGNISFVLWFVFGFLGFVCFYLIAKEIIKYVFQLVAIYIFIGMGVIMIYTPKIDWKIGGILCELFAIYLILHLMVDIFNQRKKYVYFPIGIWSLSLLSFFLFTNLSFIDFISYINMQSNLTVYTISEFILIGLFVYMIYYLRNNFRKQPVCPLCNNTLKDEKRECPECENIELFWICKKDNRYILRCPVCNNLTPYSEKCIHCDNRHSMNITCRVCKNKNIIFDWKKIHE